MFGTHRPRAVLGLTLMSCQAFCYNAVFFTYALVLTKFYGIPSAQQIGWFMLPFALGNLAGPLLLGRFFDTIGRRPMITATYALSGVLMAATGFAFAAGWLSAWEQTAAWTVIFFFASAAASAAYLTVGESFPLEMRAMAIALFYAIGTAVGGVVGPTLFGWLIEGGDRRRHHVGLPGGGADAGGRRDRVAPWLRRRGPVARGCFGATVVRAGLAALRLTTRRRRRRRACGCRCALPLPPR